MLTIRQMFKGTTILALVFSAIVGSVAANPFDAQFTANNMPTLSASYGSYLAGMVWTAYGNNTYNAFQNLTSGERRGYGFGFTDSTNTVPNAAVVAALAPLRQKIRDLYAGANDCVSVASAAIDKLAKDLAAAGTR